MSLGVLEYECVPAEDGGHEDLEFHVREILTYARPIIRGQLPREQYEIWPSHGPWTIRERIERLLNPGLILLKPPFGPKRLDVVPPDLRIPVDGITGYTQNGTLREELPRNVQSALGDETRETHRRGGM